MKKIFTLLFLFVFVSGVAQYNKWSIEGSLGPHSVVNSLGSSDLLMNYNLSGRYMFNDRFGLSLRGDFDNFKSDDIHCPYDVNVYRASLETVYDIGKPLKFNTFTKNFTILLHGGIGAGLIDGSGNSEITFNYIGGVTGLYRLSDRFALKVDVSSTGLIGQERTFNNQHSVDTNGSDLYTHTFTVGGVIYLGKRKKHSDWVYVEKKSKKLRKLEKELNKLKHYVANMEQNVHIINVYNYTTPIVNKAKLSENIYFPFDSDVVQRYSLTTIDAVVKFMNERPDVILEIIGWACVKGQDTYNLDLSRRRAESVYKMLIARGIAKERLKVIAGGKDYDFNTERTANFAKRVEFRVISNGETDRYEVKGLGKDTDAFSKQNVIKRVEIKKN